MSTKRSRQTPTISRIESLSLIQSHNLDLHTKTLFLRGEVNEKMFDTCQNGLAILNQMSPKKIQIVLISDGGCVFEMFAIYDLIKSNKYPIDIHTVGYCMSAAVTILQAGRKRTATKNTQFMTHAGTEKIGGEVGTVERKYELMKNMGRQMRELLFERSDNEESLNDSLMDRDTYFSAHDAEVYGLIDEVTEWP